ncbi:MAG: late competence development ComFB family protein, partial [Oscillospiraceae bacterium]
MAKSRKEIDKDIMYGKIMPSSVKTTVQELDEQGAVELANYAENENDAIEQVKNETKAPTPATLFDQNGIKIEDDSIPLVVNVQEYLVSDKLEAAFNKFNCCRCDRCKKDVAALALNKLKPHYVVIRQDQLEETLEKYNLPEV